MCGIEGGRHREARDRRDAPPPSGEMSAVEVVAFWLIHSMAAMGDAVYAFCSVSILWTRVGGVAGGEIDGQMGVGVALGLAVYALWCFLLLCGDSALRLARIGWSGPAGRTGTSYVRCLVAVASWHLDVDSVRPGVVCCPTRGTGSRWKPISPAPAGPGTNAGEVVCADSVHKVFSSTFETIPTRRGVDPFRIAPAYAIGAGIHSIRAGRH